MLTTGLLGATSSTSAPAIASVTPGAGFADSAPTKTNRWVGTCARYRTHHSWKWIARWPPSRSATACVSRRSSVAGSRRTPGCQRVASAWVTWCSG